MANFLDRTFIESDSDASGVVENVITLLVRFRVGPQQIAEQPLVWYVVGLSRPPQLVYACDLLADASVHAQYFFVNQTTNGQVLEGLAEFAPNFNSVPIECSLATIAEPINLIDESALVVAAEHSHVLRIPQLVGEQQGDDLDVIRVAVHVVALE